MSERNFAIPLKNAVPFVIIGVGLSLLTAGFLLAENVVFDERSFLS